MTWTGHIIGAVSLFGIGLLSVAMFIAGFSLGTMMRRDE